MIVTDANGRQFKWRKQMNRFFYDLASGKLKKLPNGEYVKVKKKDRVRLVVFNM